MNSRKFKIAKGKILLNNTITEIWLVLNNDIPYNYANQWLYPYNIKNLKTAKEYGSKLTVFLNYLYEIEKDFKKATKNDIHNFIFYLMLGKKLDCTVYSIESSLRVTTLKNYITIIKMFYKRMSQYEGSQVILEKSNSTKNIHSYMYGQIWNTDYESLIYNVALKCKNSIDHIKWYTEDEKAALLSATNTLRDKALIALTLEGLRIDEVLSTKIYDYNPDEMYIKPSRSKGIADTNEIRTISLKENTCEILNKYLNTERIDAEVNSAKISDYIFINLIKSKYQGNPMKYSTALDIIKRVAKRCGMNPKEIRTHSGRSTRVMEFLQHQSSHPEDHITDNMIRHTFGWKNIHSLDPYRDRNNLIIAKSAANKINKKRTEFNND